MSQTPLILSKSFYLNKNGEKSSALLAFGFKLEANGAAELFACRGGHRRLP